jgi:tRNA (guanine10-N2)-dimethyltransferase
MENFEQVLVLETDKIKNIHARLALSHNVCELRGICELSNKAILRLFRNIQIRGSFSVRIKRIKEHGRKIRSSFIEREAGGIIKRKTGANVKLANPNEIVYGLISDKFVLGKILEKVNRSAYESRKPHLRPFFRPGVMPPRTCRAIVNLTRVKEGDRFIDPFCGTGGFLIEAGLIGAKVYGCDVDPEAVQGCKKNLSYYGINSTLEVRDATTLGDTYQGFFHALATDLPYGISSSTRGFSLGELYERSLDSFYTILKKRGYACVIGPKEKIEEAVLSSDFEQIEVHYDRVHKSLTRSIVVLRKPD